MVQRMVGVLTESGLILNRFEDGVFKEVTFDLNSK